MEEYVKSGRDQMVIDPYPDEIYTKRKKRLGMLWWAAYNQLFLVKCFASCAVEH